MLLMNIKLLNSEIRLMSQKNSYDETGSFMWFRW